MQGKWGVRGCERKIGSLGGEGRKMRVGMRLYRGKEEEIVSNCDGNGRKARVEEEGRGGE